MNLCLPNWYTFVSWDFDLRKITFIFPNKIVFASIPKQQKKRLAGNLVSVFLQNSIPLPFLEFYEKIWRSTKTGKIRKHLVSRTTRFSSLFVLDKSQCFSWRWEALNHDSHVLWPSLGHWRCSQGIPDGGSQSPSFVNQTPHHSVAWIFASFFFFFFLNFFLI